MFFFLLIRRPLRFTFFPYTTLFRSVFDRALQRYAAVATNLGNISIRRVSDDQELLLLPNRAGTVGRIKKFLVIADRSEEHTSELQSHSDLVCRLLLEKKKKKQKNKI